VRKRGGRMLRSLLESSSVEGATKVVTTKAANTSSSPSNNQGNAPYFHDETIVSLPNKHHKLFCWKCRNGAPVRMGETIALAIRASDTSDSRATSEAVETIAAAAQYKRATKRKRPTPTTDIKASSTDESFTVDAKQNTSLSKYPILAPSSGILRIQPNVGTLILGQIETCTHPTVVESMCAVCGIKIQQETTDIGNASTMNRFTTSGGLTVTVSQQEGQRMAQSDAERLRKQHKLSLVLDLDHTLVHATGDHRAGEHLHREDVRSVLLPMQEFNNNNNSSHIVLQHFVKFRPHVKEFFNLLQHGFEIGVYTAGTREYAEQITVVLARFMVGAWRDQVHFDELRHTIAKAEYDMIHAQELKELQSCKTVHSATNASADEKATNGLSESFSESGMTKTCNNNFDELNQDFNRKSDAACNNNLNLSESFNSNETTDHLFLQSKQKNRKIVTFGEPPPNIKSDHMTLELLEELKKELSDAELLEQKAQELRQRLFGSRVISRTDVGDLGRDVKSLKRIFPCGGAMAVVVDDREDVWARAQDVSFANRQGEPPDNLILVRPYHWDTFTGFADVNNSAGVDLSKGQESSNITNSELDQQLLWTSDILMRMHKQYYDAIAQGLSVTVPETLASMRRQVLAGTHIVLSGLVPLHKQTDETNQPRPCVVRYVESLGGSLQATVTDDTTHVVASKDGTDKILQARKVRGCVVVKPSWLMECFWTFSKRDETRHFLGTSPTIRPLVDSKRDNTLSDNEDEEDNSLADAFENEFMEVE
jgi:RNA polymerase II subunit A-like phosphatase